MDKIHITKLPLKDKPWLTRETQEDLDALYKTYETLNAYAIPRSQIVEGGIYQYVLVTDSGYNPSFISTLRHYLGKGTRTTGETLRLEVKVVSISKNGDALLTTLDNKFRCGVAGFNYGKSWRLEK